MSETTPRDRLPRWLDQQAPHDAAQSRAQIEGLLRFVSPAPKRVLDLGCGAGRALVPLAQAGHIVTGVDRDDAVLTECRARLKRTETFADLREGDFLDPRDMPDGPFDAVFLLGNTIMTITDVDEAVGLFRRIAGVLAVGGAFLIDDCPSDFRAELTDGNWQAGVSEDGSMQLVWEQADSVFALRQGDAVNLESWRVEPGERRYRMWTDGSLRLAARAGGLSAPERPNEEHLIVMRAVPSRRADD